MAESSEKTKGSDISELIVRRHSISLAIFINMNLIASAIGISGAILVPLTLMMVFLVLDGATIMFDKRILVAILIWTLWVGLSTLFVSTKSVTLSYGAYGLIYLVYVFGIQKNVRIKYFTTACIWIGYITLPLIIRFASTIQVGSSNYSGIQMGLSYGMLPNALICLVGFKNTEKKRKWIPLLLFIIYVYLLVKVSTRGPLLALGVFIICYLIANIIKHRWIKIVLTVVLFGGVIYASISDLEKLLLMVQNLLAKMGLKIYAFDKMISYYYKDKLFNGRDIGWKAAIESIKENPVIHFLGAFESKNQGSYAHNIFLQAGVEFGIIGMIAMAIIIIVGIRKTLFAKENTDYSLLMMAMMCASVVPLMFSSVYWMIPSFWLFLRLLLVKESCECTDNNITL